MVDILDGAFPKGECKERGRALVMISYIEMMLNGTQFNSDGEPRQTEKGPSPSKIAQLKKDGQIPDWKLELADLLRKNRSNQDKGSGDAYWLSQVNVVEKFAKRNPDVEL